MARAAQKAEREESRAKQERVRQRKELARRAREEKLSVGTVRATTKPCPGCRWPIEKNAGCAHMTCKPQCPSNLCLSLKCFPMNFIKCLVFCLI
jgi:hypothetical protein